MTTNVQGSVCAPLGDVPLRIQNICNSIRPLHTRVFTSSSNYRSGEYSNVIKTGSWCLWCYMHSGQSKRHFCIGWLHRECFNILIVLYMSYKTQSHIWANTHIKRRQLYQYLAWNNSRIIQGEKAMGNINYWWKLCSLNSWRNQVMLCGTWRTQYTNFQI